MIMKLRIATLVPVRVVAGLVSGCGSAIGVQASLTADPASGVGVAPASVTTAHIYRGVIPFVLIQVVGLLLLWFFPSVVTIVPNLLS